MLQKEDRDSFFEQKQTKIRGWAGKSYSGEGSASFGKLEKPVWRPMGRKLNKFRSLLFTIMKQISAYH